jgi:hypothetical protein
MPIVKGEAFWAHVHEPNTMFEHRWSVDLFVSEKDHQDLLNMGLNPRRVKMKKDGSAPTHPDKEVGEEFFTFKRNVRTKAGKANKPPRVVDAERNPIPTDTEVGNGSVVRVLFRTYSWNNAGNEGVASDLDGLQVIDLVEYQVNEDFDDEDGYVAPAPTVTEEKDPFDE